MQHVDGFAVGKVETYRGQQLWYVTDGTVRRYFTAPSDTPMDRLRTIGRAVLHP